MMSVAILFTASCAKEDISSSIAGEETIEVFFATNLADLGTRAYDDGSNVDVLHYIVCDNSDNPIILDDLCGTCDEKDANGNFHFSLKLVKTMTYNISFWAQNSTAAYTIDNNGVVSINYANNNGNLDAFYCKKTITPEMQGQTLNIQLRRPFAQLNALTSDGQVLLDSGVNGYNNVTSTVAVKGVYSQFNLISGQAQEFDKTQFVTFGDPAVIPAAANEELKADYTYLSMCYLFASENYVADVKFIFTATRTNNAIIEVKTPEYTSVPLKPNFRTNILGALLTNPTAFNVEVEAGYDAEYDKEDETTTAKVKTAEGLAAALADNTTNVVVLQGNIDLSDLLALSSTRAAEVEALVIPAGKEIVLDLNGCTISKTKACTGNYNMILNKGTLTIKDSKGNGKISFKDTGAGDPNFGWGSYTLRNEGTLVVENGTIEHLGEQNPGNGQPNVHMYCAIFQYSGSSTINGGTISTPTYRSARLWNGDMTINGGNFVGQLWLQAVSDNANLTINGGTFAPCGNDSSAVFVSNSGKTVTCAIKGGRFTKFGMSEALPCVYGGTFTEDPSAYVANGYIATKKNDVYTVVKAITTEDDLNAIVPGDTIKLTDNITLSSEYTVPADVTIDGNGKQINGTIYAGGNLTFVGHTKVTAFSASYYDRVITIGEGACLEVTGTGRVSLAYGNTFNITGNIADAKSADKTTIQPSLIIPGGISITGGSNAAFNVTNAYVKIGSTSSKNSAANGTFTLNITNSIAEFTDQLTFAEPTSGKNPTFNINVTNSVLTTATKLCIAAPNTNMVVDNSTITLGSYFRNSGKVELKNGSVLTGSTIQFGENGGNNGQTIVDNSTFTISASSTGHALDGKGTGSITLTNNAEASVTYYKAITVTTDATSTFSGTEVQ